MVIEVVADVEEVPSHEQEIYCVGIAEVRETILMREDCQEQLQSTEVEDCL